MGGSILREAISHPQRMNAHGAILSMVPGSGGWGGWGWCGGEGGAFPGISPGVPGRGVGAASARVDVSPEGMFLLISLQNSQHTDFSLAVGKSRVLSYKKMPHQGKPCVWPRKLPCRPGGWGVVGRSAG